MSGGVPMLCIKCKQEIPDISVYCMFCGKKQASASAEEEAQAVPAMADMDETEVHIQIKDGP